MDPQEKRTSGQGKVMLRYLNGPTETYQCETVFNLGLTGLVSQKAAHELIQKRYEGKEMFVLA